MQENRYLSEFVKKDIQEKMVFIGGPRQVGKTTLAKNIGEKIYKHFDYLNYDNLEDKKNIIKGQFKSDSKLIIFDEIHKYKKWKNYVKGIFDKYKEQFDILITGSARLDLYRKGGDSLQGRYHYLRLHPFSISESISKKFDSKIFTDLNFAKNEKKTKTIFNDLLKFGGFPEPYIKQNERTLRRWQNERIDRLIKEDIRDVELIRDLSSLQILTDMIPSKVGSIFSLNSLREDLQVTHKTVSLWTDILERFYFLFRIYPFNTSKIKSLRKEPKIYLWDWSCVENEGAKLENLVASHLFKFVHFLHDVEGYKAELNFLRDIEGREVDFIVSINKKPWFTVEVKSQDTEISKNLKYFTHKIQAPFNFQLTTKENVDFLQNNIRVMSAWKFLSGLV